MFHSLDVSIFGGLVVGNPSLLHVTEKACLYQYIKYNVMFGNLYYITQTFYEIEVCGISVLIIVYFACNYGCFIINDLMK